MEGGPRPVGVAEGLAALLLAPGLVTAAPSPASVAHGRAEGQGDVREQPRDPGGPRAAELVDLGLDLYANSLPYGQPFPLRGERQRA